MVSCVQITLRITNRGAIKSTINRCRYPCMRVFHHQTVGRSKAKHICGFQEDFRVGL